MTFDDLREIAHELSGVQDGTSWGTPALKVSGKFLARMWEDGETLVLRLDFPDREILLGSEPEVFFLTDHYRGYPAVLVHLPLADPDTMTELLETAWRFVAPPRLVQAFEAGQGTAKTGLPRNTARSISDRAPN